MISWDLILYCREHGVKIQDRVFLVPIDTPSYVFRDLLRMAPGWRFV